MAQTAPTNLDSELNARAVVITGYADAAGEIHAGQPTDAVQANAGAQASKANAVQGITGGVPIPVSFTGGGDASAANQVITNTEIGIVTETTPATDTASSGLNGRLQRLAQRITSLIALLPTALGAGGGLKVDGSGTALPVSLATSPALVASEAHIGEIGGNTNTVSVEFTRESNATPYAAGDVISSSAGSPVLLEIPNAVRINGGSAYVTGLAVVFNVKSVTPRIRVHFFNASPAAGNIAGDNLPLIEKYADASRRLRYVELPAMITAADATNSDMSRSFITPPPFLPVQAAAGSRSIFVLLETLDAVTLTSGSKVTVVPTFDNN